MRVPELQALTKRAIPLVFPGLIVDPDLSNRTATASASTTWTIWNDPVTNKTRRSSAADGLLWAPDQQRDTLTVLANHTVDRVLFSRDGYAAEPRATGVAFAPEPGSALSSVFAGREVILAAGSLGSAPILERSGIGARQVLESAGIQQIVDLPGVGVNRKFICTFLF
jgi:choline dehydrogenase